MSVGHWYGLVLEKVLSAGVDFSTDDFKATLHGTGYAWDQDADEFYTDTTSELTGTGYSAGGIAVTGITFNYVGVDKALYVDIDDPTWTTLTMTGIKYCVIRKDTGVDATSPLVAILVNTTAEDVAADDYSFVVPTEGLLAVGIN